MDILLCMLLFKYYVTQKKRPKESSMLHNNTIPGG